MTDEKKEILVNHALKKAKESIAWWREKGAIYDESVKYWLPLNEEMLHGMELALETMAEEIALDLPEEL